MVQVHEQIGAGETQMAQLLATLNVPGVRGTTWSHAEDLVTPATLQAGKSCEQLSSDRYAARGRNTHGHARGSPFCDSARAHPAKGPPKGHAPRGSNLPCARAKTQSGASNLPGRGRTGTHGHCLPEHNPHGRRPSPRPKLPAHTPARPNAAEPAPKPPANAHPCPSPREPDESPDPHMHTHMYRLRARDRGPPPSGEIPKDPNREPHCTTTGSFPKRRYDTRSIVFEDSHCTHTVRRVTNIPI